MSGSEKLTLKKKFTARQKKKGTVRWGWIAAKGSVDEGLPPSKLKRKKENVQLFVLT